MLFVNDLQLWGLRLKSWKAMTFEISELVVLTIRKARKMMILLVKLLHMRIDSGTVTGVQELASGFTRRGFSFIFSCDLFYTPCILESCTNLIPRPSSPNKHCAC